MQLVNRNIYGTVEIGGLPSGSDYHDRFNNAQSVPWDTPGLRITRLRLLSDPGHPVWEVSYCHGELDSEPVVVDLPFSELPKRSMRRALYAHAKATGCFIEGLFDNISTLN